MLLAAMINGIHEDDDDDKYYLDFIVYQMDRLQSELLLYNPTMVGLFNEGQKLMRSPLAVNTTVTAGFSFLKDLTLYNFISDEDRYYDKGVYNDELRLRVSAFRATPLLNQYLKMERLAENNRYYILYRPQ